MTINTAKELNSKLISVLTYEELAYLNPNIYLNEDHLEYYMEFNADNFTFCYEYIMANIELLNLGKVTNKAFTRAQRKEYELKVRKEINRRKIR